MLIWKLNYFYNQFKPNPVKSMICFLRKKLKLFARYFMLFIRS